jgi:hypothetical protein
MKKQDIENLKQDVLISPQKCYFVSDFCLVLVIEELSHTVFLVGYMELSKIHCLEIKTINNILKNKLLSNSFRYPMFRSLWNTKLLWI